MESRWNEMDASAAVGRMGKDHGEDLALRVYTSRLIGQDTDLVVHGGGNTSVKTTFQDLLGRETEVLCVKGSGWDLISIEPAGLPGLDLQALRDLRSLRGMSDEEMVHELRRQLWDPSSPNPSVETLLHAFLPDKFVDHTHADAALVFGNRPEGQAEMEALFGDEVGVLPWTFPGFPLAKKVADYRDAHPEAIGLILHKHGVFSWGPDARTSYERMIEIVDRLEKEILRRLEGQTLFADVPDYSPGSFTLMASSAMPALRRLTSIRTGDEFSPHKPMIAEWRPTPEALAVGEDYEDAWELFWSTGPLTPDHVIRTKSAYVVAPADDEVLAAKVADYAMGYTEYFHQASMERGAAVTMLDPYPRVFVIKGVGLVALGKDKKAAIAAADIAEHTLRGKKQAQALGSYEALTPVEVFDMEYWSLEQAKLGKTTEPPLGRRIALVTGAAGAIGRAVCRRLLQAGAHVVLSDLAGDNLAAACAEMAERYGATRVRSVAMDLCDETSVKQGFREAITAFGGLDILVMNHGIAHVSSIQDMELADWDRVHAVNETGTLLCFREASRIFQHQGLGGQVILNASKNVPAPGAEFSAYSASKAGAVQIARVAALELAEHGVTVNMVHADGVFSDEDSGKSSGLWDVVGPERMAARGLDPDGLRDYYKGRNLLKVPVQASQVAEAIAFFAERRTPTTGAALTVDGGHAQTFYR